MEIIVDGCLAFINGVEYSAEELGELGDAICDAINEMNDNYNELFYVMHPKKVLVPGECPF